MSPLLGNIEFAVRRKEHHISKPDANRPDENILAVKDEKPINSNNDSDEGQCLL